MMGYRRYLAALLLAGGTAAFTLLYPRFADVPGQMGPESAAPEISEAPVPWPTPPSASPLSSTPPVVIVPPSEPRAAQLFLEVNRRRNANGLASMLADPILMQVAQLHADDMARRRYLDHTTPDGVTFQMRINASGYAYDSAGENLGFASHIGLIVPDWLRSVPHRENIDNPAYRRVGVATADGTWQGIDVVYAAMVFADPK